MTKRMLVPVLSLWALGFWAISLQAAPIAFSSMQYTTGAFASAGGMTDSHFDASPPSSLPLLTSATAAGNGDSASAAGTVDNFFLGTSADANSSLANASALGSAEFIGDFTGMAGIERFLINFDSQNSADAGGTSAGTLLLRLISNGVIVLDETFSTAGLIERTFDVPFGALTTLDLLLTSSADATLGTAFNLASADFSAATAVPATPTGMLVLLGLILVYPTTRPTLVRKRQSASRML